MTINWKKLGLAATSASALLLAACADDADTTEDTDSTETEETTANVGEGQEVNLAYVLWDSEIASTHVLGEVFEDLGYEVDLTALDNAIMWESVASGETDAMVSAWLPGTHEEQYNQYADRMDHVGTNLEGAAIGMVVPAYMDVDSIEDLTDEADQTVTGIEAGAGVVAASEEAVETYDNLSDWNVQTSSSGAMATALSQAYQNEEDIVVTGWSPHWKFSAYDLKYLEDPQGVYGEAETIDTFAREGLSDDMPEVYHVLENFYWTTEDMEEVMLEIQEGAEPEEAARNWVDANEDVVSEWTAGLTE